MIKLEIGPAKARVDVDPNDAIAGVLMDQPGCLRPKRGSEAPVKGLFRTTTGGVRMYECVGGEYRDASLADITDPAVIALYEQHAGT